MKVYYDLDFENLKENIKTFMASTDEFKDYNFEGSGASQIIDVLAFITQYPAFYLSQALNELFMSTTQITNNVYKLAHQLNYLPKRRSSAYLDCVMQRSSAVTIIIPKFTQFKLGDTYLVNVEKIIIDSDDEYTIRLYEGEHIIENFISDGSNSQIYELINRETVDNDYLFIYVDQPDGLGGYILGTEPWVNVNKESFDTFSNGFYIRYFDKMSIAFDNGNLFNKPSQDERVRIVYLNTTGADANGKTGNISLENATDISNSDSLTITNTDYLKNGTNAETETEIRNRAPLFYTTQNRAVTENDHNVIAKTYSKYDIFASATLWGGEKEYIDSNGDIDINGAERDLGHVYLTALKTDLSYPTQDEIDDFIAFLNKQKFVTIFFKYLRSNIIYLTPNINISFKTVVTDYTDIRNKIDTYLATKNGMNTKFYLSDLIRFVDNIDIVEYTTISYTTKVKVQTNNPAIIRFSNGITPGSISSVIDGLNLNDINGIIYHNSIEVGWIDYSTGFMRINSTFTDTEYEINFEYSNKEKVLIERENFLKIQNVNIIEI